MKRFFLIGLFLFFASYTNVEASGRWIIENGYTYYLNESGEKSFWEQNIDGKEYYFDGNGVMYKGWLNYGNGKAYYFKENGQKAKSEFITTCLLYTSRCV